MWPIVLYWRVGGLFEPNEPPLDLPLASSARGKFVRAVVSLRNGHVRCIFVGTGRIGIIGQTLAPLPEGRLRKTK